MLLQGKRILVTGAAAERGIGLATCRLALENGAEVIALDIAFDRDGLQSWETLGGAQRIACDVTSREDCRAVADAVGRLGPTHGLIHCAGVAEPLTLTDLTRELYQRMLDVNLWGTMQLTQALLPSLRASGSASIVCMSSLAGQRGGGFVGGIHYAAAKAGVLGFMRGLARELGAEGIRVNAVSPGLVDTDMTIPFMDAGTRMRLAEQALLRRLADPREIAGACVFLASDLSSYVTGATLDVNGGLHIH